MSRGDWPFWTYRDFASAPLHRREAVRIEQLAFQGGQCALCDLSIEPQDRHRLVMDHSHLTDRLRGLLCPACNLAMAAVDRGDEWLSRAVHYRDHGAWQLGVLA